MSRNDLETKEEKLTKTEDWHVQSPAVKSVV